MLLATSYSKMTVFLDYKHVDEDCIRALEMTTDENDIKRFEIFLVSVQKLTVYGNLTSCGLAYNTGFYTKYSMYQVIKNQSRESSLTIISITTRKAHNHFHRLPMRVSKSSSYLILDFARSQHLIAARRQLFCQL